jgi:hypothetical protein
MPMPLGPASGDGARARRPSPPSHRPTWLLVLSSITLIYGGLLLVSGLTALRDPASAARFPATRAMAPDEEALTRELMAVNGEIVARHARGIRGRAAASAVLALLMLYSAAAALSRDRNGRTVTLLAAWLGIAYQLGSLPVVIPIATDYAAATGPLLARMVTAQAPAPAAAADAGAAPAAAAASTDAPPKPESVVRMMHTVFLGIPIATSLVGIIGSLLLIAYFGGRRGRALYGIGPTAPRT